MVLLFVIAYSMVSDFRKNYLKRAMTEPLIYDLCFHKLGGGETFF